MLVFTFSFEEQIEQLESIFLVTIVSTENNILPLFVVDISPRVVFVLDSEILILGISLFIASSNE